MKECKHKWKEDDKSKIRCLECSRFQECYNKKDLYEPTEEENTEEENTEEENIWSADGVALIELKEDSYYYGIEEFEEVKRCEWYKSQYNHTVSFKRGNVFKTKDRAELERDRIECEYIMKKMACESRYDNDWRKEDDTWPKRYYYINFYEGKFEIDYHYGSNIFNGVYFKEKEEAENCLDFLLEKYGNARLKEIWGIRK